MAALQHFKAGLLAVAAATAITVEIPTSTWTTSSLLDFMMQSGHCPGELLHLRFSTGVHYIRSPIQVAHLSRHFNIVEISGDGAILDGGIALQSFSPGTSNVWTAPVPEGVSFSQLFVNEQRRPRARSPNAVDMTTASGLYGDDSTFHMLGPLQNCSEPVWGQCPPENALGFLYNTSDARVPTPTWDLSDAWILTFGSWTGIWTQAGQVYPENSTLLYSRPSQYRVGSFGFARNTPSGGRWLIENAFQALDAPGEWYASATQLFYIPMPGETPSSVTAVVANTSTLLDLRGLSGLHVHDLVVRNFAEASATARFGQGYSTSAAIEIAFASNVTIQRVNVTAGMGSGILVEAGVVGLTLDGLQITDVGGNGISAMLLDGAPNNITDMVISNCTVRNVGFVYLGQPGGIVVSGVSVSVLHNEVSDVPYGAIQAGWQHGTVQPAVRPEQDTFTIAYNYVHDFGLGVLSDFGGIYVSAWAGDDCWTRDPPTCYTPTQVHHNLVTSGRHYAGGYGSNAGYMDEGVGGVLWHHNVFSDVGNVNLYFHCGTNNSAWNNVFYAAQQMASPTSGGGALGGCNTGGFTPADGEAVSVYGNIIVLNVTAHPMDMGDLWLPNAGPNSTSDTTAADNNVYWATGGVQPSSLIWPNGTTLAEWTSLTGNDVHSLIADPLFVDAPGGDFSLQPTSPAWALGWTPIDLSSVGPLPQ